MIQCLANANYLLKTHPKFFREKSKQFLLGNINMQLEYKIKELNNKVPFSAITVFSSGWILLAESFWH